MTHGEIGGCENNKFSHGRDKDVTGLVWCLTNVSESDVEEPIQGVHSSFSGSVCECVREGERDSR